MTRDEWYRLRHDQRLARRQWRLISDRMRQWAQETMPVLQRLYKAFEPVMLAYERQHLVETLGRVRDSRARASRVPCQSRINRESRRELQPCEPEALFATPRHNRR